MRKRLCTTVLLSGICLALAVVPTSAGSSRVKSFSLNCDGHKQTDLFNFTGFPVSTNQFILGGAVTVSTNSDNLKYLLVQGAAAGDAATVLTVGPGESSGRFSLPTFFQVAANATGKVPMVLTWVCTGPGDVTGFVTILFN